LIIPVIQKENMRKVGCFMKIVRCRVTDRVFYGVVEEEAVKEIEDTPFIGISYTSNVYPLSDVQVLAPVMPSKILALALNYASHIRGSPKPAKPEPFFKTPSSVVGPGESVILPKGAETVQEEAELVVVIGRKCRKASRAQAMEYVLGYTCGNDVSAREWQRGDVQWWRAKSSDTFSPIGPYIVTDVDNSQLNIWARVNGREVQHCNTSELLFDVPTLISFISDVVTLEPGDLVFTGTSGVPAQIKNGDVVEVEIEGIGVLSNPVVEE
jgi:2-keto-4-pentenoate hydratase/2-oxohepta-3-ene-1,7-dioic acid hydratase in catechol pathway